MLFTPLQCSVLLRKRSRDMTSTSLPRKIGVKNRPSSKARGWGKKHENKSKTKIRKHKKTQKLTQEALQKGTKKFTLKTNPTKNTGRPATTGAAPPVSRGASVRRGGGNDPEPLPGREEPRAAHHLRSGRASRGLARRPARKGPGEVQAGSVKS